MESGKTTSKSFTGFHLDPSLRGEKCSLAIARHLKSSGS